MFASSLVYFGHSGLAAIVAFPGGPVSGYASRVFIGQAAGLETKIEYRNVSKVCDPTQGCNIDNYLSKNTAIRINGCEAGERVYDLYAQLFTAVAQMIAQQLKRGVYANEVGAYFSQLDAAHDNHVSGEQLKHPPNSLPMYVVPAGVPGRKPDPTPFVSH
jgi:hypothetical protein